MPAEYRRCWPAPGGLSSSIGAGSSQAPDSVWIPDAKSPGCCSRPGLFLLKPPAVYRTDVLISSIVCRMDLACSRPPAERMNSSAAEMPPIELARAVLPLRVLRAVPRIVNCRRAVRRRDFFQLDLMVLTYCPVTERPSSLRISAICEGDRRGLALSASRIICDLFTVPLAIVISPGRYVGVL